MSMNLRQHSQLKIKTLKIITKFGDVNILGIFQELNIYDSMFMPCIRGDILINDAMGLSHKILFDGSEYLSIEVEKGEESDEFSSTTFKKVFRIYKQGNRQNLNQNSEVYILYFSSEEMIFSEQQKINQSFTGTYSDIVNVVLKKYLDVSGSKIRNIEKSKGLHTVIIPNLSPFDTLNWLSKRAVNTESLPNFLFFENKYGYNFVSLSYMINQKSISKLHFYQKDIIRDTDNSQYGQFYGVREAKIINSPDVIENIKNGLYAGKFIGIDPLTRKVNINNIDLLQTYGKTKSHLNKYPNIQSGLNRQNKDASQMFDSKVSLYAYSSQRESSSWIKQKDPKTRTVIDDTHAYVYQRAPILANLLQTTIHLNVSGNFGLTSGAVIDLEIPVRELKPSDSGESVDDYMSGRYIITATRHIIKVDRHETVIEVASDSTNRPLVKAKTNQLTQTIKS